jgi:hypothetical protein
VTPAPKRPRPACLRLSADGRFWVAEGEIAQSRKEGLRRILGLADCGPQPGNCEPQKLNAKLKAKSRAAGA